MNKLHGIVTAMVTPFDKNGNVLTDSVRRHVDFLVDHDVNCLYPLGTTGEMLLMQATERKAVAEIVVEQANHRLPVFVHVGAMTTKETVELAKHAHECGADGIGAVTPSFFGSGEEPLYDYYASIARSVPEDFPVYLYNIPQCSSNDLPVGVANRLAADFDNIVGIKYSYPDVMRLLEYQKVSDGHFSVLSGCDKLINVLMAIGCDGVISGVSSVYPEPFVATYKACQAGNWDEARKNQLFANQIVDILKAGASMGHFKEALKLRGIDAGFVREPLHNLSKEEITQMADELKNLKLL